MTIRSTRFSFSLVLAFAIGGCSCNESQVVAPIDADVSDTSIDQGFVDDLGVDSEVPDADVDANVADADLDATSQDADVDSDVDADVPDTSVADLGVPDLGTDLGTAVDVGVDTGPAVPTCRGTPVACNTLSGFTCTLQDGCVDGTFMGCTGTPDPCSTYASQFACTIAGLVNGCAWSAMSGSCNGTPTACATRNANTCLEGCTGVNSCSGTATACTGFTTQGTCALQQGCTWQ